MSERSDQKRPLPPAILADALQDRPSKPDVTAQAFREAATRGDAWVQIEADGTWTNLLLAAAEQREQWEALTAEHNKWVLGAAALSHEHGELEAQIATLTAERDEARAVIEKAQFAWQKYQMATCDGDDLAAHELLDYLFCSRPA